MKRRELIKTLKGFGCNLLRNGAKHDIYHNPSTGVTEPVPRYTEINEILARKIIKSLGND